MTNNFRHVLKFERERYGSQIESNESFFDRYLYVAKNVVGNMPINIERTKQI